MEDDPKDILSPLLTKPQIQKQIDSKKNPVVEIDKKDFPWTPKTS